MPEEPSRQQIDSTPGLVLLEFGASWCPHCAAVRAQVAGLLAARPDVRHVLVEDGPGRPLGRSFGVKLWPTFVFLRDGVAHEVAVRPDAGRLDAAFARLAGTRTL